jgi:hypothetical protein
VQDTHGVGHKTDKATCSTLEAGSVVELSDASFLQMLQVYMYVCVYVFMHV